MPPSFIIVFLMMLGASSIKDRRTRHPCSSSIVARTARPAALAIGFDPYVLKNLRAVIDSAIARLTTTAASPNAADRFLHTADQKLSFPE